VTRRLEWLDADGKKLLVTRLLRTFGYGYLAVVLAIYLQKVGLGTTAVGALLTAAVLGSMVMTIFWSLLADRYGRRRTVATMSALMIVGGLLFAFGTQLWVLMLGAFTGTISASSSEVGPFQTVEQAILPGTVSPEKRTWLFSVYEMLGNFAGAIGALFAGTVALWSRLGLEGASAYRPLFLLYSVIGAANLVIFLTLSPKAELAEINAQRNFVGLHKSTGTVVKLSALFAMDSFAGGLVLASIVAYWFHAQWHMSAETLGIVFFWVGVLSGLSFLAAGWLAERIGLLNTMVFTHLPSNILLILVPLMPSAWLAVALFLARMTVSQMDVPTRKSYIMAVVEPDERTPAAGITNVARTGASAISPILAGSMFGAGVLALPFYLAGGIKIVYDGLVWKTFHNVLPPEERERRERRERERAEAGDLLRA
jgi:MFS family permease